MLWYITSELVLGLLPVTIVCRQAHKSYSARLPLKIFLAVAGTVLLRDLSVGGVVITELTIDTACLCEEVT